MLADWSAECAAEDPVLVVPWGNTPDPLDPLSNVHFIDLRENPYDLDQIAEAELHPPLMQALRSLNAPRSPVFTAKCDAWPMATDEVEPLCLELDLASADHPVGFASYIDLLPRERTLFASFHQQEQFVSRLIRRAASLDLPQSALDCVLRPALVDLAGVREGFSISLYVKAVGPDAEAANQQWATALQAVVTLLRGKDFAAV